MNECALLARVLTQPRTDLRLCARVGAAKNARRSGGSTDIVRRLLVWTQDEWEESGNTSVRMRSFIPTGVWCALRHGLIAADRHRAGRSRATASPVIGVGAAPGPGFAFVLAGRGPSVTKTSVPSGGIFSVFVTNTRSASSAELAIGRSRIALPKLATVIRSPSSAA